MYLLNTFLIFISCIVKLNSELYWFRQKLIIILLQTLGFGLLPKPLQ